MRAFVRNNKNCDVNSTNIVCRMNAHNLTKKKTQQVYEIPKLLYIYMLTHVFLVYAWSIMCDLPHVCRIGVR